MVLNKTDGTTHFTKEDAEKLTLFGAACGWGRFLFFLHSKCNSASEVLNSDFAN